MNNRQRVYAALEGKPVDRAPVTSLYNFLYHEDHFSELTGQPAWKRSQWLAMPAGQHAELFAHIHAQAPFELLQPHPAASRSWREQQEFVERDGRPFQHDKKKDTWTPLDSRAESGHATDSHANEKQLVFTTADVDRLVKITPAGQLQADGYHDFIKAVVERFGRDEFIISQGVVGTFYRCHEYVGLTNLFPMLIECPTLIEHLSRKMLEQNIEMIRCLAAGGGDAIYIDDATATCDMISAAMYERFSLPYMTEMVREVHRLGLKAILIYFGGISDRLEQIATTKADGLVYEASMKGFVNDTREIARRIGSRMSLFSNIDPVGMLQNGTDEQLDLEIRRQLADAAGARGFILSTPSPITPSTPLARVQRFISRSKQLGQAQHDAKLTA